MRKLALMIVLVALTSCGGSSGDGSDEGKEYYISVAGSKFDTHELSDVDHTRLLEAPVIRHFKDGAGEVVVKLPQGDWVTDYIDELYTKAVLPQISIVTGERYGDGVVMELSRDQFLNSVITGEVIHGSSTEEYIEYTFRFNNMTESEDDVQHVLEIDDAEDDVVLRSFQTTRYIRFAQNERDSNELRGATRFPAIVAENYLKAKPNDLVRLGSYTIALRQDGNQSAGFKVELLSDRVLGRVMEYSNQGKALDEVTIYQVDNGRPSRLQTVFRLQDVLIEDPNFTSGSSAYAGEDVLSATLSPTQYVTTSLEYDRRGQHIGNSQSCVNIENGPQQCTDFRY